jgi:predicted acylesterase/phospholipase RssA
MYRTICFSGGCVGGFAHLGFLTALGSAGLTKTVDTFAGTSIGALVALLCAMSVPPAAIYEECAKLDSSIFRPGGMRFFYERFGLDDGEYVEAFIMDLLIKWGFNPTLTLGQLWSEGGKRLLVTTTDLHADVPVYMTPESHPNEPVVAAVRKSISFPFVLTAVAEGPSLFVDGGVDDNYPIEACERDLLSRYPGITSTSGLLIGCNLDSKPPRSIRSLEDYVTALLFRILRKQTVRGRTDTVTVHLADGQTFAFFAAPDEQQGIFNSGRDATLRYLNDTARGVSASRELTRRRSI